jgi:hypothetical protein
MSSKLDGSQNAVVGACVGAIEVACLQPFNFAKNSLQQGIPISMSPPQWYRGVVPNIFNMAGCTMIQFAVGGNLKALVAPPGTQIQPAQEMGCGLGAGMVSAMWGSPMELTMIQQQRKGTSLLATMQSVVSSGNIGRGFVGCAIREGLWTVGYLSLPPIIRKQLREYDPVTFDTDNKARVPASLIGGAFACYLTQPIDTIKTCMQGDIERVTYKKLIDSAKTVYAERGFTGFYNGATFRYGRMVCAVFMMDTLQGLIGPALYPKAFE